MKNKINNIVLYSLIVFSIYCALTIGMSWDELDHIAEGNKRLSYLFSFGLNDYWDYKGWRFYPGFYNTFANKENITIKQNAILFIVMNNFF